VVFGHFSTGAADDLSKATDIARNMITRYGMADALGPVTYETEPNGFLGAMGGRQRLYSEETAREIDVAVRRTVEGAFERARAIVAANRTHLEKSAHELLEKETLADGALAAVLGGVRPEGVPVAAASPA
jgi:cell division protease FtsH